MHRSVKLRAAALGGSRYDRSKEENPLFLSQKRYLLQELTANELSPLDAEQQRAARIAQVSSVQHQLQQHVTVAPGCQIRLLRPALAEGIQQPHVLRHVCCQDSIHNQSPGL